MKYHLAAFVIGIILDLIFGDPYWLPHPIRWIGSLVCTLEKKMNPANKSDSNRDDLRGGNLIMRGSLMVVIVVLITFICSGGILGCAYYINCYVGMIVESVMTYQILAMKCLRSESMKVYDRLADKDINGARKAVSMIVGRDTEALDDIAIAKAAIETVAENTSDGVIAPMIYTAIGGPIAGMIYKAINTMDSMVGYKNDRYLYFGRAAAKVDDIVNYLPSRLSSIFMMAACALMGREYDAKNAYRIYRRDCRKHASPNSAQTESSCAGALSIQLAGDAYYFGQLYKKPFIGDAIRSVEYEDIRRANNLMYMTGFICAALCSAIWIVLIIVL